MTRTDPMPLTPATGTKVQAADYRDVLGEGVTWQRSRN